MAKTIADYKRDYAAAEARGDAAGMKAANDGANAIRAANGQATQSASVAIANTAAKSGSSGGSSGGTSYAAAARKNYTGTGSGGSYTVGSELGIDFIENKPAGSTMTGGDGSTWVKNADGSTTIVQNGQVYTVGGGKSDDGTAELIESIKNIYGSDGGYAEALRAQQAANAANVEKAVGALNDQKTSTDKSYADMFRQLYLNKMQAKKNLNQQMAAQGITGGAAESTMLGIDTRYQDALRQGEDSRIAAQGELDRAIADAQLTGDIENAQLAADSARERANGYASVLQNLLSRQDSLNTQKADEANTAKAYAYQTAMQLLQSGNMASDELLASAGIGKADAAAIVAAAKTKSTGSGVQSTKPTEQQAATALQSVLNGVYSDSARSIVESYYGLPLESVLAAYGGTTGTEETETTGEYNAANFERAMTSLSALLAQGNEDAALSGLESIWHKLSALQRVQAQNVLKRYGIGYQEG